MSQITTLLRSRGRALRSSAPSTTRVRRTSLMLRLGITSTGRRRRLAAALSRRIPGLASGRPSKRSMLIGGSVILGAAVAVPMTRAATRTAKARLAARRDRRSGIVRGLDALTSLPNRAEAEWWLNRRLDLARMRGRRLAVLVMDIDDFAACNEAYGRAAGDHVLQVTAARLQALLRTGDMVCRTGNDTFMVIMDVGGPDHHVARIGERVVDAIAEPISFSEETIFVTASVGFAISHEREGDPQLLLGRADRAVIQAKASQRPIVQF